MPEPQHAQRAAEWGRVTEFSEQTGHGFVEPEGGGERLLFVAEATDDPGGLEEGAEVAFFRVRTRHGQFTARGVSPVGRPPRGASFAAGGRRADSARP